MHTSGMCHVRADAHGDDRLSQKPSGFQSLAPANERMGRDARNATPRIDVEAEASCLESHGRQVEAGVGSRAYKLPIRTRLAQKLPSAFVHALPSRTFHSFRGNVRTASNRRSTSLLLIARQF
jgi:hypothetical protein